MKKKSLVLTSVLFLLAPSISPCFAQAPTISAERLQARKDLGQLGVEYSKESFVKQAAEGDTIAVQLFLAAGMNPNSHNKDGKTALWSAANSRFAETVQALIAGGASVNPPKNANEQPALVVASQVGCLDCVKILVDYGADPNAGGPLYEAASQPDSPGLDIIKLLVAKGAAVDGIYDLGPTPLMRAARGGSSQIVRFLVEHGANVKAGDSNGETALIVAARAHKPEIIRFLIERGADVNAKTKRNNTALINAADAGDLEVAKILLVNHADVNVCLEDSNTALTIAVSKDDTPLARLLLEAGADVNVHENSGYTVLMLAASKGNLEIVKALVEKGADVNAKAGNNTPLSLASGSRKSEIIQLLLSAGAKQ